MARPKNESGNTVPGFSAEFEKRFETLISALGGQDRVSELLGVAYGTVTSWKFGRTRPDFFALQRLCEAASVHINWLATGVGPRDSSSPLRQIGVGTQPEQTGVPAVINVDPSDLAEDALVLIPQLDVQPSAGTGTIIDAEAIIGRVAFNPAWLRARNITPQGAHVLTARGDSMEPTIRSGDDLIVDTAITEVVDNGIYVVAYGGSLLVKRLRRKLDGSVVISSDNQLAGFDETVPAHELDSLRIAGRVMWFGRII